MNHSKVTKIIEKAGFIVLSDKPLPNGTGQQLILFGHAIVNVFNTGRCTIQGTPSPRTRSKLIKLLSHDN